MRTRIKICCISSIEEANLAIKYGTDALGLVGKMPSGLGPIKDELILKITSVIPPPIASFLLTSEQSASSIITHLKRTSANTVQIVDELNKGTYLEIRDALPQVKIVQVIHVTGPESIQEAQRVSLLVDAILLDSGKPLASIKILGGTGIIHNWDISSKLVASVNEPVFLAGGLNANNVCEAIERVRPYGVDVCNGVRTNGALDPLKLAAFIAKVKSTDYTLK